MVKVILTSIITAIILGTAGFAYNTKGKYDALHNRIALNRRLVVEERRAGDILCLQIEGVKRILNREHRLSKRRSLVFLREHPHGVDGITRKVILQGIRDQERIIRNTNPKKCLTLH